MVEKASCLDLYVPIRFLLIKTVQFERESKPRRYSGPAVHGSEKACHALLAKRTGNQPLHWCNFNCTFAGTITAGAQSTASGATDKGAAEINPRSGWEKEWSNDNFLLVPKFLVRWNFFLHAIHSRPGRLYLIDWLIDWSVFLEKIWIYDEDFTAGETIETDHRQYFGQMRAVSQRHRGIRDVDGLRRAHHRVRPVDQSRLPAQCAL